ncbi:MAG: o-succinylbenzoate--CoA ligase [Cytophagia bacterium]|nr:o-succinylbenzoate--CoA ligase [Cytophagia bacterium]
MNYIKEYLKKFELKKDKISIVYNDKSYTYESLLNKIKFYKKYILNNNIKKGEVVSIVGDYSLESISLFFSLCINNNIIVPITSSNKEEINIKLNESSTDWVIYIDSLILNKNNYKRKKNKLLKKLIDDNDPGLILFSSGSTGIPKSMLHNLSTILSLYLKNKFRNHTYLVFLMFDHIGGLNTMFNIFSMTSTMVIPKKRDPENISRLIEKYKVRILPASPTFLNLMYLNKCFDKYDFSSVILITYGTEPMSEILLNKLRDILPKTKFLQTFGTSETGIIKTISKSSSSLLIKFDDPNQEYKIVNDELWLRSKTQVLGYLNHSNKNFTNDGWFKTGDLVEVYDEKFLKIKGRKKEVINIGGEKVLPIEVESVINKLDYINDCTIYSENHSIMGQIMIARIVIDSDKDFKEIKKHVRKHCKKYLDSFKVPSKFIIKKEIEFSNRFKKKRLYNDK